MKYDKSIKSKVLKVYKVRRHRDFIDFVIRILSSVGRAAHLHCEGRGFKSLRMHKTDRQQADFVPHEQSKLL